MSGQLRDEGVDLQLWSTGKNPFAVGTLALDGLVPVFSDAALAEVVTTWCADWLSEHVQTNGAQELIFSQQTGGRHIDTVRTKSVKNKTFKLIVEIFTYVTRSLYCYECI